MRSVRIAGGRAQVIRNRPLAPKASAASSGQGIPLMSENSEDALVRRVSELEDRVAIMEAKLQAATRAYSLARHSFRRRWLRPPLWTFEQYAPRRLTLNPSYAREKPPAHLPLMAIATPTRNYRRFLRTTIESVLSQSYPHLAYHVQDGNSTDGTVELLGSYGSRFSWRSEQDGGQTEAINRAFATLDGDIMGYLNSDDALLPGTLFYVGRAFENRPDIDLLYGHRVFIDSEDLEVGRAVLPPHDPRAIYWADYIPQETLFWRRRVWDAVGPFDETFSYAFDWDFILRAQAAGFKFLRVPRFLACFRVHDAQKTAVLYETGRQEMQRLRKRYLGREPGQREILRAISPYLARQFAVHHLYKWNVIRH
jgi:Glycosyl transferase family 2